jgi:hypothetical protein
MKKIFLIIVGIFFVLGCATAGGLQTSSDPSAKVEKVEFKPDKAGRYYAHVTRNLHLQAQHIVEEGAQERFHRGSGEATAMSPVASRDKGPGLPWKPEGPRA